MYKTSMNVTWRVAQISSAIALTRLSTAGSSAGWIQALPRAVRWFRAIE